MGQFGTILGNLGQLLDNLGQFGGNLSHLEQFQTIWDNLRKFGTIWSIWDNMGATRDNFSDIWGQFGPMWPMEPSLKDLPLKTSVFTYET